MCSIFESEKQKEDSVESQAEGGSKKEGKKPKRARTSEKGKAIKVLMRMGVSDSATIDNSWVDESKIMQVVAKMGLSGVLPSQFLAFLLSLSYHVGHSGDLRTGTHMLCHVPDKLF